jgi:hypothetical protein
MRFFRRRRVWVCALIALPLLAPLVYVGRMIVRIDAEMSGYFEASQYPRLFGQNGWARYGLPPTLPANATNIVIYAPSSAPSLLPAPDQFVEVRFFLPPTDAQALAAVAATTASQLVAKLAPGQVPGWSLSLETADDANPSTPLPAELKDYYLANPSGSNVGGVSINPKTGEVVYWIRES